MSQAVIQSLESIIVDLPTIRPHKLAMHTMNRQTLVILRLRCSDGIEGLGEATTIGGGDTGRDIEEAERMLDLRRHRHFKLKIGAGEVDADVAHAIAIKRALGERASVRVDVNQAWDEGVAQRACATLGDNGIALIEQPIARHNRIGLARLSSRGGAPIMADEAIESVEDAFHLAREGAAPVFALKIAKNGGPRAVLRSAAIAEAAGIGLYGGTMLEGGIGTLAAAHAFVTLDRLAWHSELFGPLLLTEDILLESPRYQDFHLHVPRAPGLGLALDEERLARFRRR
nr:enolase C-terminal domain-like protein [Pseudomonas aeruginosa]